MIVTSSRTSFPKAWQEGRLHDAVVERLRDAVIIPQGLVVQVHQRALQLPDLGAAQRGQEKMKPVRPLPVRACFLRVFFTVIPGCVTERWACRTRSR